MSEPGALTAPLDAASREGVARHLPRLTAARAFAALAVFAFHASQLFHLALGPLSSFGYAGVSFFFILSGFVLTWGSGAAIRAPRFYGRRFSRIYPAYAVVLVLTGVLGFSQAPTHELSTTLCAVLLVQAWLPNTGIYAINPPAWSLSVEAAFYAAMPFLHAGLLRLGRARRWSVVLGWFLAFATFVAVAAHAGGGWTSTALANPLGRAAEFLLGMLAAFELRAGHRLRVLPALAVALGSLALCALAGGPVPLPTVELDPLFAVVIVVLAQADLAARPGWFLTGPTLAYLGAISYEFYLVHQFVLDRVSTLRVGRFGAVALSLAIALLASSLLFELVQRPLEGSLRPPRRALAGAFGLVGASAAVLVAFTIPRAELPVRTATVAVAGAISVQGAPVEHVHGSEVVDFSAEAASASGTFALTGPAVSEQLDEETVGATSFYRLRSGSAPSAPWRAVPLVAGLPGRPDDDPAHLAPRVRALGSTVVVGRPLEGTRRGTRLRITVQLSRLSGGELRQLSFATLDGARTTGLTMWMVVDADHLVRQLQYRDELADGRGRLATVTATYTFSHFNDPAPVVRPPASASDGRAASGHAPVIPLFN
ncbi:MAG TPA: acyltransferase [Acidimicrobiales bacterium]|nr:acyltransferase [Acidimicrobiales bacterium]